MNFANILVVCVGNICRSPVGERLLQAALPDRQVSSAGIGALEGHAADETMTEVAAAHDLSLDGHIGRQINAKMAADADLILVMESGHKAAISRNLPGVSGKVMLFDQWTGADGIPDPYRERKEVHESCFEKLSHAAQAWANHLRKA